MDDMPPGARHAKIKADEDQAGFEQWIDNKGHEIYMDFALAKYKDFSEWAYEIYRREKDNPIQDPPDVAPDGSC